MRRKSGRLIATMFAVLPLTISLACTPLYFPPTRAADPNWIVGTALTSAEHERDAEGGGRITMHVTVFQGLVPDTNMIGLPTKVAEFRNWGPAKENRYKFKRREESWYELILTPDPKAGKTRWDLYEVVARSLARSRHSHGHLWTCHPGPAATARDVSFQDCTARVEYDPSELAAIATASSNQSVRFASFTTDEAGLSFTTEEAGLRTIYNAPIWISCNSGCCSLGR